MKKRIAALLGAALLAASAAGCASQPSYPDGVYFAAGDMDAGSGYRTIVTVKVSENRIESVDWNEIHYLNGDKKALGDAYGMKGASSIGKEWYEQAKAIEDVLVKRGPGIIEYDQEGEKAGKVKNVSGASISVANVLRVFDQAMGSQPVPQGSYRDGVYFKAAETAMDGYRDAVTLVVANGTIVLANWDKVAAEPAQGEAPTLRLQEASGAFDAQAKDFAAQVLANQGTVEAVDGPADIAEAKALLDSLLAQAQ